MDSNQQGTVPGEWQYEPYRQPRQKMDWQTPFLGMGLGALLNKKHPIQGALTGGLPLAFPLIQQLFGGNNGVFGPMFSNGNQQTPDLYRRRWMPQQQAQQPAPQQPVQMQTPPPPSMPGAY